MDSRAERLNPGDLLASEAMDIDRSTPDDVCGIMTWRGFNRNEVLMLLLQTLDEMGFE